LRLNSCKKSIKKNRTKKDPWKNPRVFLMLKKTRLLSVKLFLHNLFSPKNSVDVIVIISNQTTILVLIFSKLDKRMRKPK